jgi:hypothetical protein
LAADFILIWVNYFGVAIAVKIWRYFGGIQSKKDLKEFELNTGQTCGMTSWLARATFRSMSAAEIIQELPRLSEADRRQIREVLLEIANQDQDVALCNQAALEGAQLLDRMEDEDARHPSR